MTRESLLCRVKRQIRMGIYESDDKWQAALARLTADMRSRTIMEPSHAQRPKRGRSFPAALAIYN